MDESTKKSLTKGTAENNIRPGFQGGSGGGETPAGLRTDGKAEPGAGAASDLRSLEDEASGELGNDNNDDDNIDTARQSEQEAAGFYSGKGKLVPDGKKKGLLKGKFLKKGPIFGIILSIFGMGGIMAGMQASQPFSLLAQFQETFNSMHVSANERSNRFIYKQMDSGRVKDPIKKNIFGGQKFKISSKQAKELAKHGITVNEDFEFNGKKVTVLEIDNGAGQKRIITADAKLASKMRSNKINAISFDAAYSNIQDFFNKYNAGSKTWRGQIANWFGETTSEFLKRNKLTRNMFRGYEDKGNTEENTKVVKDTISKRTESFADEGARVVDDNKEKNDADEEKLRHSDSPQSEKVSRSSLNADSVKAKVNKVAGKFTNAANIGCAVAGAIGAINMLVVASEAIQIINITTAYFETYDKVKAGYGTEAPIGVLTDALNTPKTNKNVVIEGEGNGNYSDSGIDGLYTKEIETKKTAMEAAAISALYSGTRVNPNDPSVSSFNLASSSKKIMSGVSLGMDAFKGCTIAKMGAAMVSAGIDIASGAACVAGLVGAAFTFGATALAGCFPLIAKTAATMALGAGLGVAISGLVSLIVPKVASMMTRDLVSELGGEDLGNALVSGANMYLSTAHRSNGGSLSTPGKYQQFAVAQEKVVADNARYERQNLSPFDLTSKNTFLGTIMTSMMNFSSSNSLMSMLTSGSKVVSSSALSLIDETAIAYNVAEALPDMEEYEEVCPYLASINAVGDSFCNPYVMTDVGTMDYDPAYDVIDTLAGQGNFEDSNTSDDNVIIKKDSDLAKYILYCDQRESAFGVSDYNIASEIGNFGVVNSSNSLVNSAANGILGSTVIGDALEIINDEKQLENLGYISGESCVAGNTVNNAKAPGWDTAKYYQRFIEDQSLAESMGLINKSAVVAFLDDYYEQNPLDESYEGVLARKTGMTKDDVIALLEIIDYYDYLAKYDPSERYNFLDDGIEAEESVVFDSENVLAGGLVLPNHIIYRDIRNRSYAV